MPDQYPDPLGRPQPENHPPRPPSVPARMEFLISREERGTYRCPCSEGTGEQVMLHPADRDGRICEAPDWEDHQTVTCRGCGRFGRLLHAHPGTGEFPVIGVAELPAACPECLAPAGEPCRDPFCPGQHASLPAPPSGAGTGGAALPSTRTLVRTAIRNRVGGSQDIRPGRLSAHAAAVCRAMIAVRRLRRDPRVPAVVDGTFYSSEPMARDLRRTVAELLDALGGHSGVEFQRDAVATLGLTRRYRGPQHQLVLGARIFELLNPPF